MYGGLGDAIGGLIVFSAASLFVSWPLAIWKLIDICIWIYQHVEIGLK